MSEAIFVRRILVLGASGLIGRFVTDDLRLRGFHVTGIARHFAAAQKATAFDLEMPVMSMDAAMLAQLIRSREIDVAVRDSGRAARLIHISIPGAANDDRTAFSVTKREAERLIAASGIPHAILRPGFVVAPSAYGGSALLRALAALPLQLPARESATPFQPVAIEDVAATIAWLAGRDIGELAASAVSWDLMQPQPVTLGGVIEQFRGSLGTSKMPRITLPAFLLSLGSSLGDLVSRLGWMPPVRSTAIAELRRGVSGDPAAWMAATGIVPKTIAEMVGQHPATIQDKWFARLFLLKALVIASLVLFWTVSGFISLVISYDAAAGILRAHNFPPALVGSVTVITSLMDMSIGILIAFRRTSVFGLIAGIAVSLGYMAGAAILTPDIWIEPLGALVKTGPAIVLMLVALLTLDNR
jgi:uncharacterized protein YbjT (DUF2867 family)